MADAVLNFETTHVHRRSQSLTLRNYVWQMTLHSQRDGGLGVRFTYHGSNAVTQMHILCFKFAITLFVPSENNKT